MSAPPAIRAVLFDFSGTLFDDAGALTTGHLLEHARRRGLPLEPAEAARLVERTMRYVNAPEQFEQRVGADLSTESHRAVWTAMIADAGPGAGELADLLYETLTDNASWFPYPDAAEVIATLREHGLRVGVLSNIGWDIRAALARAIDPALLDAIVLSCEVGLEKPDPAIFTLACARLGTAPAETLFVGDDPLKDGPAVRAGLPVYLLPDERSGGEPRGLEGALRAAGVLSARRSA